jgi:hypothetical protein
MTRTFTLPSPLPFVIDPFPKCCGGTGAYSEMVTGMGRPVTGRGLREQAVKQPEDIEEILSTLCKKRAFFLVATWS